MQAPTFAGNVTAPALIPSGSTVPTNGMYLVSSNFVGFSTATTYRGGINATGQFLINATISVGTAPAFLEINGASGRPINTLTSGTGSSNHISFNNGGGQVGSISTSGSTTSYNTSSDYRLKEDVAPLADALATIAQLKPCNFTWKTDGTTAQGFIAHELQAVVPACVTGLKDAEEDIGTEFDQFQNAIRENCSDPGTHLDPNHTWQKTGTRPIYQAVDSSFLIPLLVAAIQQLKSQIATGN